MEGYIRLKPLQGGNKQRGRGLPIHIKVAPNANAFILGDRLFDPFAGSQHAGHHVRGGGGI